MLISRKLMTILSLREKKSKIQMSECDKLESELMRMFASSWVELNIFKMGDVTRSQVTG
jgi:hypothetical protein